MSVKYFYLTLFFRYDVFFSYYLIECKYISILFSTK
jgi:hypothetical protein